MAAAGLWTTPEDLTRLELEITRAAAGQSRLLGQELAIQMLTPQVPSGMGLGTEIATTAGHLRFGRTGGDAGYRCFTFAWPGAGTAVAVMANSEGATEILGSVLSVAQRMCTAPQDPPAATAAPPDVTGRYLLREDYPLDIRCHDAALTLSAAGQDTIGPASATRRQLPPSGPGLRDHLRASRRTSSHARPPGKRHPDGNPRARLGMPCRPSRRPDEPSADRLHWHYRESHSCIRSSTLKL